MARKDEPQPEAEESPVVCEFKPVVAKEPTPDPFAGRGGVYELNLLTGERQPVTKTEKV